MNTCKRYISYFNQWFNTNDDSLSLCKETDDVSQTNNQIAESIKRPWGHYTSIFEDGIHSNKVTRIVVLSSKKLLLQSRNKRSKHWIIIKGYAKIQIGTDFYNVGTSIHVYVPINTDHCIENIGSDVLEFIEIQIG